jgi:predicted amidophosphoribosyltransferase
LLRRRGGARRQRGLPLAERRRNVQGAFSAVRGAGSAVLVDDVYTTGATVHAAAVALGGNVEVVTFARAVRRA